MLLGSMTPPNLFSRCLFFGLTSLAACSAATSAAEATAKVFAERLRCECLTEPSGVDHGQPELSWIVTSPERGQKQTAYRVLVASTREKVEALEGDLWDSGKVASNATYGVRYAGSPLTAHQECYWRVMSWDKDDKSGDWSESSSWSIGILGQADWKAEWIGFDAGRAAKLEAPVIGLDGARWIRHEADAVETPPEGLREYHGAWDLPEDCDLRRATLAVAVDDRASIEINGVEAISRVDHGSPLTDQIVAYLKPGRNQIRVTCRNHTPGPTGICLKVTAETFSGEEYIFTTDERWTSVAREGDAQQGQAAPVSIVGPFGCEPWGRPVDRREVAPPPSYLRNAFSLSKKVRRATAYLASLGCADLSLNGKRVNDDYFSSGWTDYRRRVYYRTYDVTGRVNQGDNAWGIVLADGWYSGHVGWSMARDHYGRNPRVAAMLRIEFEDGSVETHSTNDRWKASSGPTRLADFLVGEEYDATLEQPGWDRPGFDDKTWQRVDRGSDMTPRIEWHPGPPVVEVQRFPAKTVTEPAPAVYVYDLGQNFAGVAQLRVRGRRGQQVRLRFAERLNPNGTIYTENLRAARVTDYYACRGDGEEVWSPRHTFHGFQYVELTGIDRPAIDAVVGVALSSDTPLVSEFDCSDPGLNRLYQNVLWTQRSNFIDVPTDCPQRDERMGWTGDAQVYVHTACITTDVQAFFRKWLVDLTDAQRVDGQFPKVAPVILGQEDGGPAWADAGVICPWEVYLAYGDHHLLEQQYPSMVRFVEFCRSRSKDGVLPPDYYHCFGDWLSVNANTPNEVIYTAYYARSVDLLRQAAVALGESEDAARYGELFDRIKAAFVSEYVTTDGQIKGDTQCCYVLAIGYGLIDGDLRDRAAERLIKDIESRGWKLSTGFVGTKDLMLVLSQIGRQDVALRLLHQPEYPGWLFSISHGATSIWERWDGWTPDRGFQDPGMNSFAHYSFGAVYGWMVENLGGIQATAPGYKRIVIEPTFDPSLQFCRVIYDSIRGPIRTSWRRSGDVIEFNVTVPTNTTATIRLRGVDAEQVKIDGKPLDAAGVTAHAVAPQKGELGAAQPIAVFEVPSGVYLLSLPALGDDES